MVKVYATQTQFACFTLTDMVSITHPRSVAIPGFPSILLLCQSHMTQKMMEHPHNNSTLTFNIGSQGNIALVPAESSETRSVFVLHPS